MTNVIARPMVEDAVAGSGGKRIFVRRYDNPRADYVLVLVHGTAGNSEGYDAFAEHMRRNYRAAVYSFDLTGHGRTEGRRGMFSFEDFLEDTRAVTDYAARRTSLPVVLHGASQGGEVAFHALDACSAVKAGVCMNILLNHEIPMSPAIRLFQSRLANWVVKIFGDRLRVPLTRVIDFNAAYQEDPGLLDTKKKDPFYVWRYGLKSYHSVFNYVPPKPAAANTKPVLVTCGEHDEIVSAEHCRACFERIGGTKDFFMMPGGGHQLMLFDTVVYGRVIDSWIRERVLVHALSWEPPIGPEERRYFEFLDRERANDATGEPEYRYSIIDRALMRISNGTIERGVRYFSNADVSEQWRFTADLVGEIDYAAWEFLRDYLPSADGQRPRMAVVGCGTGGAIDGLLRRYPELRQWEIVGVDVDYKSIDAARKRFADVDGVTFVVGDARDPEVLGINRFDLFYLHGVLDHCTEHRRLMDSVFGALRPGGRMFYVAPDRNVFTWLCFVTVGPMFVFGLHRPNHDFRRFPRPAELNTLLTQAGFELLPRRGRPDAPAMVGVEYKSGLNPFPVKKSVRTRTLTEEIFEYAEPRWWLRNGFVGEYAGAVQKPATV